MLTTAKVTLHKHVQVKHMWVKTYAYLIISDILEHTAIICIHFLCRSRLDSNKKPRFDLPPPPSHILYYI